MNQLTQYADYEQYKAALDSELQKTAEGFVRIGYLLKVARDTDILKESGYKTVTEFAQAEYNIDKTQVSRFIHINDKFAEGGYSDHLLPEYQGYGYAKLTLMLALPDEMNEELSPDFSKSEIQTLKQEYEKEQEISEIEVMLEEKTPDMSSMSALEKLVYQLFKENADLFKEVWIELDRRDDEAEDIICPTDKKIYVVRIPGEGRYNLTFKENGEHSYLNQRDLSRNSFNWDDFWKAFGSLQDITGGIMEYEQAYKRIFGEDYPEYLKDEVAPVQPRKETKVQPSKPAKEAPKEAPKEVKSEEEPAKTEPEETEHEETDKAAGGEPDKEETEEPEESKESEELEEAEEPDKEAVVTTAELISEEAVQGETKEGKTIRERILDTLIDIEAVFNASDEAISPEEVDKAATKIADVLKDIGRYREIHNMEVSE